MGRRTANLDHFLQLRLPKETVAEIDEAIEHVPQLIGFNRCGFIRHAVHYVLDSIRTLDAVDAAKSATAGRSAEDAPERGDRR
jgi:hypothetical protein